MASMSDSVAAELLALGDLKGWRADLALTLAEQLDESPNASMARELRAVMNELGSDVKTSVAKGDVSDDLKSRRDARIAAASGS